MATLPVASVAFILAVPLLDAWLGEGWGSQPGPLARIALDHASISTFASVVYAVVASAGKLPELLPWILAALAVNLLVNLALVGPLGLGGGGWGTLAGHLAQFLPGAPLLPVLVRCVMAPALQRGTAARLSPGGATRRQAGRQPPLASGYGVAGTLSLAAVALACWIPVATGLSLRPAERATLKHALSGGDSQPRP